MNSDNTFPELRVVANDRRVEISAIPDKSFDCVEFSLRKDVPQIILEAPWIQFESIEQSIWRQKWAIEICRRAQLYDNLVKRIKEFETK